MVGKIEYLPLVVGDLRRGRGGEVGEIADVLQLRKYHFGDVGVILDTCDNAQEKAINAGNFALMGAKCAITADLKTRLEAAEKEGA